MSAIGRFRPVRIQADRVLQCDCIRDRRFSREIALPPPLYSRTGGEQTPFCGPTADPKGQVMSHWETPGASDEWYTPRYVFDALGCRFDLDVAHPGDATCHVPARTWITSRSLDHDWWGFVWMNPPFGGRNAIAPWLDKFFAHGDGIALTPDRTSAPWFQDAWRKADAVLFTRKIRFLRPDGTEGVSPSNGTALFAIGDRGVLPFVARLTLASVFPLTSTK